MVERNSWENYNLNKDAVMTLELEILAKKKRERDIEFQENETTFSPHLKISTEYQYYVRLD